MKKISQLVFLCLLAALALSVSAAEDDAKLREAVKKLGSDSWNEREEAMNTLWKGGRAAEALLRAAKDSKDPEVAWRVEELLGKFRFGLYPDTPKEIAETIERYRAGERDAAVQQLFALGDRGTSTLMKLCTAEEDPAERQRLFAPLWQNLAQKTGEMLLAGKNDELEIVLEQAAKLLDDQPMRHYIIFLLLSGKLEEKIQDLEKAEKDVPSPERQIFLCYLYRAKGDWTQAAAWAGKSGNRSLQNFLALDRGDWPTLAKNIEADNPDNVDQGLTLFRIGALRYSGKNDEADQLLERVKNTLHPFLQIRAFFAAGKVKEARELLLQHKEVLLDYYTGRREIAEALKLIDSKQVPLAKSDEASMWFSLGEMKKAYAALESPEAKLNPFLQWRFVGELSGQAPAEGFNLAVKFLEGNLQRPFEEQLLSSLFFRWNIAPNPRSTVRYTAAVEPFERVSPFHTYMIQTQNQYWWGHFLAVTNNNKKEALTRYRDLLTGAITAEDFNKEIAAIEKRENPEGKGLPPTTLRILADMRLWRGEAEEAQKLIAKLPADDPASEQARRLLCIGNLFFEKGEWQKASDQYAAATAKFPGNPFLTYMRGLTLVKLGKKDEGEKLILLARLIPLGDESGRFLLSQALVSVGLEKEAAEERLLMSRLKPARNLNEAVFSPGLSIDISLNEAMAKEDYKTAALLSEKIFLRYLAQPVNSTSDFLKTASEVLGFEGAALVQEGKIDEAMRKGRLSLDLFPSSSNGASSLIAVLRKNGKIKEADELLQRLCEHFEKHLALYPSDATTHNDYAWMLALCRANLETGLKHALKSVELSPDTTSMLDTLGEIYYLLGKREQAIETLKKCQRLVPGDRYYKRQVQRFEAYPSPEKAPPPPFY